MSDKEKKTIKLPIIISVSLSIIIILLILNFTIDAQTIEQLRSVKIKYEFFGIAILLNIIWWILWGFRLKILANAVNSKVKISLWETIKIVIANLFLAGITPSMAGGEPVRIYLLKKNGMSTGSSTATVLGERLIDAFLILFLVPFAFFIFKDQPDIGVISTGLWIGVIVFILIIIFFLYAITKPDKTKGFLIYISRKFSRFFKKEDSETTIINRINKEVDNFHKSMTCFVGNKKKALLKASIITVLYWSSGFLIPSFILLGLGLPPFWIESYAAQILLLVLIMMPTTPGSSGVAEAGVFGLYGVLIGFSSQSLIGVFVILFRFVTYHLNLVSGAFFQYKIFKSIGSFSMDTIEEEVEPTCDNK